MNAALAAFRVHRAKAPICKPMPPLVPPRASSDVRDDANTEGSSLFKLMEQPASNRALAGCCSHLI